MMSSSLISAHARASLALCAFACAATLLASEEVAARTLAEVQARKTISMCANPDALPYSSKSADDPGFQIELGRAIAADLGLPLETEWIVPRRRATTVNCDMMFDSLNDPKVYEGRLLLSRPYQKSGVALGLAREAGTLGNYRELQKGQKIGVMVNSVASVVLGKGGATTSPYAFQTDMIEDLAKGQLYGAAISAASLSYYIRRNPDSGLRLVYAFDGEPDMTWDVSVGLRKSDQALVDAVNKALDKLIADGTLAAIYARYGVEHRLP